MKLLTKWDKILIVILLLVTIASTFLILITYNTDNDNKVVIQVNGKTINEIQLNKSEKPNVYKFTFNGNIGYIEIKNESVRMLEMDKEICPEKICSDTGWISKGYQTIVCLPNKIVVSIVSSKNEKLDAISE